MNPNKILLLLILTPIIASILPIGILVLNEKALATGGAGEIKGLIDPILERAITALQNGDIELALEEIETLQNELDDTFEADKE